MIRLPRSRARVPLLGERIPRLGDGRALSAIRASYGVTMPTPVHTAEDVRRLIAEGAQLVEVLPRDEYEEQHLPGAVNLPLKELNAATASGLRRDRPVVVYCWDSE